MLVNVINDACFVLGGSRTFVKEAGAGEVLAGLFPKSLEQISLSNKY